MKPSVRYSRRVQVAGALEMTMIPRMSIALPAAILAVLLFAPSSPAQGRGGRGSAGVSRARSSFRSGGRERLGRPYRRRFFNDAGLFFPPYFYADDLEFDNGPEEPGATTVQLIAAQPAPPPAPPAPAAHPLLLEFHDGQWVRIPTGTEIPAVQ